MPTANCGFPDMPESSRSITLVEIGPTIAVQIGYAPGFDGSVEPKPTLQPDLYPALVDTGASDNSIDNELAAQLRLPVLIYDVLISGSIGVHATNFYLAQIYVPELNRTITGRFTGVNLAAGGQFHRAIIGRSFLQDFALHYDGRAGEVTISDD